MELKGSQRIGAHRDQVWSLLNDVDVVRSCIPGCETFAKVGEDKLLVSIRVSAGPIIALFKGHVALSHVEPPKKFKISGEGHGGDAGLVMGEADISLISDESDTVINYALKADVGGRLAGIGSNLLEVTMQKYANDFVGRFNSIVCEKTTTKISTNHSSENFPLRDADSAPASSDSGGSKEKNKSMSLLWVSMGAIILLVLIWLFR